MGDTIEWDFNGTGYIPALGSLVKVGGLEYRVVQISSDGSGTLELEVLPEDAAIREDLERRTAVLEKKVREAELMEKLRQQAEVEKIKGSIEATIDFLDHDDLRKADLEEKAAEAILKHASGMFPMPKSMGRVVNVAPPAPFADLLTKDYLDRQVRGQKVQSMWVDEAQIFPVP